MILSVAAICDIGCKRSCNQDMILLHDVMFRDGIKQAEFNTEQRVIIALADGVGGLARGEIASEQVLKALSDFLMDISDNLSNEELNEVFNRYSTETHEAMNHKMGSTLVGLFLYNGKLFRYHAGDSRLYRMRHGYLERLTIDHSLRESGGQKNAPSNVITNAIGGGSPAFIEFAEINLPFYDNDIYMLSSDGMHDLVPQSEISDAMKKTNPAQKLTDIAKSYGGKDNISVITIKIES